MGKNILFISRRMGFNRGGGEQVDLSLAQELKQRGHEIVFLVGADRWGKLKVSLPEFPYLVVPGHYLVDLSHRLPFPFSVAVYYLDTYLFERAVAKIIGRVVKEYKIEVIELLSLHNLAFKLQKRFPTLKVVVQFPGPLGRWFYLKATRGLKNLFANGDGYTQTVKLNPLTKLIPNGVDLDKFARLDKSEVSLREKYGIDKDVKIILSVGRLVPLKNYPLGIEAMKRLSLYYDKFIYLIAGEGSEREKLERQIVEQGLQGKVRLLGAIANKDLAELYSLADVFILTSAYESFGIVLVEAFACGVPVVATDVGGVSQIVEEGQEGFLVPSGNAELLAERIHLLLSDSSLHRRLQKAALLKSKKYTWKNSATLYERYFLDS